MPIPSSISTRLQYQHKSLLDLIEGLSDEQIRMQVNTGKWNFENIVHLQTYQHAAVKRIRRVLDEENPSFERYTAESRSFSFHDNCTKSTREIMQDLLHDT